MNSAVRLRDPRDGPRCGGHVLALLLAACGPTDGPVRAPTRVELLCATGPAQPPVLTSGVITTSEELRLSFKVAGIIRSIGVNEARPCGGAATGGPEHRGGSQLEQGRQLAVRRSGTLPAARGSGRPVISEGSWKRSAPGAVAGLQSGHGFNWGLLAIVAPRDASLRKLVEEREFVQLGRPF
jgi:hypothetical protein